MGTKYLSHAKQREICRANGDTYIDKIDIPGGQKMKVLFCNYPFTDPKHRRGLCAAHTCTDMRKIPQVIADADKAKEAEKKLGDDQNDNIDEIVDELNSEADVVDRITADVADRIINHSG